MRLIALPLGRKTPASSPLCTFVAQRLKTSTSTAAATPAGSLSPIPTTASLASSGSPAHGRNRDPVTTSAARLTDDTASEAGPSSLPSSSSSSSSEGQATAKPPLSTRISAKASEFWLGLATSEKGKWWKRPTYRAGERLMDRIDFEEWALKGVDPALGPSLGDGFPKGAKRREEREEEKKMVVPLLYPPSLISPQPLLISLRELTAKRTPHHRKWLYACLVVMPITMPFALVPVIPNFPFFYAAWRAWSHWKAMKSSQYLSDLLSADLLMPTPSADLDDIYRSPPPSPSPLPAAEDKEKKMVADKSSSTATSSSTSRSRTEANPDLNPSMLLKSYHVHPLLATFQISPLLRTDVERARLQAAARFAEGGPGDVGEEVKVEVERKR